MIREAIERLASGRDLAREEAAQVMRDIVEGEATAAQLGAFLTALRVKEETAEEMAGMAAVMREKALRVDVEGPLVDTCGTGGDAKGTFNISTAAAFVVAGAGLRVAKHGNRAASGACGSADVLEALGVKIDLSPKAVRRCIEEIGIGFMFAPRYHPAMKFAADVRREIGIRTVFNVLGPLTNPARPEGQLLGVAHPSLGEKMARVLDLLGTRRALVVCGEDGLDELGLSGENRVWDLEHGAVRTYTISLQEVGLDSAPIEALKGGSPDDNARIMQRVLHGEPGPMHDVVVLNGAAAIVAGSEAHTLEQGAELARHAIKSGGAALALDRLVELSRRLE